MKRLLGFILLMAVLVAAVTGCGGAHRYDGRLTAADSLMHDNPDSALAIIQAVCPDSLTTEGDRAYRDLLLTQARYKCYIVATSDSDINRALAYYRQHKGEREKLTRAYIYKGAVMEELGHPDSAMFYYKHAEASAAEKDYANIGYINLRIADLYRLYFADEQTCYEKFKTALHYFKLTNNKQLQQNCLYNMASLATALGKEYSANLDQALNLAIELNDSSQIYNCQELLCRLLSMDSSSLSYAKKTGFDCLENYRKYIDYQLLLDMAFIYANENRLDSARLFINSVNIDNHEPLDYVNVRKYMILSAIAKQEGDSIKYNYYNSLKSSIVDSIDNNHEIIQIQQIENLGNSLLTDKKKQKIDTQKRFIIILSVVFLIVLAILFIYHLRRIYDAKSIIRELLSVGIDKHESLLEQMGAKDSVLEGFIKNIVTFMHTSIDASENDPPAVIRKRIRETVGEVVANDDFWTQLYVYLDKNHNNIISSISQNPKINESDKRFIALSGCGFSYIEMSVILDYSPNYISNKRKKIIRKLGLKTTFQDYLNNVMN